MAQNFWDQKLNDDGQDHDFPVADPGVYEFEVSKCEAKNYTPKPGSKIGACGMFHVTLRVEAKVDGKDKDVNVFDNLYADPSTQWKIVQFAKCIGVWEPDMTLGTLAKRIEGGIGKVEIGLHEYNGKTSNEVKSYIVPDKDKEYDKAADASPIGADDLPF